MTDEIMIGINKDGTPSLTREAAIETVINRRARMIREQVKVGDVEHAAIMRVRAEMKRSGKLGGGGTEDRFGFSEPEKRAIAAERKAKDREILLRNELPHEKIYREQEETAAARGKASSEAYKAQQQREAEAAEAKVIEELSQALEWDEAVKDQQQADDLLERYRRAKTAIPGRL